MLETERLLLRPMVPEDVDPLLRIFTDPLVMAAFDAEPFERGQMQRWVQRNLDHQERHGYGLFSVILRESGELIGDCGLEEMELDGLSAPVAAAELGYDFRSDYWNRGLATEAASAVRDYAFGVLTLPCLISLIRQGNLASRRVAERIGMRHERDLDCASVPYWLFTTDAPVRWPVSFNQDSD
jgi:RimJ/RimL family protein N-acetyltransferase